MAKTLHAIYVKDAVKTCGIPFTKTCIHYVMYYLLHSCYSMLHYNLLVCAEVFSLHGNCPQTRSFLF